jgi:hypothetical protein
LTTTVSGPGVITFALHSLGWKAFQDLCATALSEIFSQTFQVYSPTKDDGQDGYFLGSWVPQKGEKITGSFTVQCKFTSKETSSISVSALTGELSKLSALAKSGHANSYILMTNHSCSAPRIKKIEEAVLAAGAKHSSCSEKSGFVVSSPKIRVFAD